MQGDVLMQRLGRREAAGRVAANASDRLRPDRFITRDAKRCTQQRHITPLTKASSKSFLRHIYQKAVFCFVSGDSPDILRLFPQSVHGAMRNSQSLLSLFILPACLARRPRTWASALQRSVIAASQPTNCQICKKYRCTS